MAYVTPDTSKRRIVALGAVGAVHGLMAVVLLTGFAGGVIEEIKKHSIQAWNYMPPMPKPSPEPQIKPSTPAHETRQPQDVIIPLDPGLKSDVKIDPGPLPPIGSEIGGGLLPPLPTASPSPTFTPRAAAPLGAPGRWVSDADYPAAALRRGAQGITRFELTISPDGRVRDCRIARSSGSADLDAATCARLTDRAHFTPARDEHGDLVVGHYAGVIRWQIPE